MYDAVVVGAGPAGSATAAQLAARGHRVVLVDRAHFPRPKPCAEYISPGGAALLGDLGVFDRLTQSGRWLRGMEIRAPGGACHLVDYRGRSGRVRWGLSLARTALDAALVEVARGRGVEVREGVRIVQTVCEAGAVCGVVDADGREIGARVVIGADGLHSVIARAAGPTRKMVWPRRLGLVQHFSGVDWPEDFGQMHVGRRGYVGVAPLDDAGCVTVGLVRPLHRTDHARFAEALADYPELAARLSVGTPEGNVQGVGPLARRVRAVSGRGFLLVGDAAGFFDPFTGEGIFRALRGAELAASAADAALNGMPTDDSRARADAAVNDWQTDFARARADAFAAKERLTLLIQVFVQTPKLMDLAVRRLRHRPHVARRLGNMLGDLEPASLGVVFDLLKP
jgi:flavin-dependent dehydrogenase